MNTAPNNNYGEEELVAALKKGDGNAMGMVYDRYSKAMFNIIYRIVENQEISEDVLQESFVKVWKNIGGYDSSRGSFFTWILNICRNSAIDKTRSKEFIAVSKNQNLETVVNHYDFRSEFNPETLGLKTITEKLKPEQKKVVDMVYFHGYSQVEVAEELDVPLSTVKTRLRTAIFELRKYCNPVK